MTNYGTIPVTSSEVPFLNHATQQPKAGLSVCRPWKEMVRSFNFPSGFYNTFERIETNLNYFLMNYVIIVVLVLFFSLVNHAVSLMVLVALLFTFSMFLYILRDKSLVVFHHSRHNTVMFILSIITVITLLFTGAVLNIISALLIGAFVVEIHAFFRKIDDLFLDEEAAEAAGLITSSSL